MSPTQQRNTLLLSSVVLALLAVVFGAPPEHAMFLPLFAGAVTHPLAVRQGVCNFVVDQLDEGSPPGKLIFQTSGDVEVATLTLANPAFGAADGAATATAGTIVADSDATGGTIAKARLKNAAGTDKIICSVTAGGGGGDIELNSVVVSAGQEVDVTSLTYEAMP